MSSLFDLNSNDEFNDDNEDVFFNTYSQPANKEENSHPANNVLPPANDVRSADEECFAFRGGFAVNESLQEYEILMFFLRCGRGRSKQYLKNTFNLSESYLSKIAFKNNWDERILAYDRWQLSQRLAEQDITQEKEHRVKLEEYRQKQEFLAEQSSAASAKILHLMQRKLDKLLNSENDLSIQELVASGTLAVKLSELQKSLGSQALGVDALLEALEDAE